MAEAASIFEAIALKVIQVPRFLSRQKLRLLGPAGVLAIVSAVANQPDEYTRELRNDVNGLACALCKKLKHPLYFGGSHPLSEGELRVCRYCRRRIKNMADDIWRTKVGLPKAKDTFGAPAASDLQAEEINQIAETVGRAWVGGEEDETERAQLVGALACTGPALAPYSGAQLKWYSSTSNEPYCSERRQILSWWGSREDKVLEWFLREYGMFITHVGQQVEQVVCHMRDLRGRLPRTFHYFMMERIYSQARLWNILAADLNARAEMTCSCLGCGRSQRLLDMKPEHVQMMRGKPLALCNQHWKTVQSALWRLRVHRPSLELQDKIVRAFLGRHQCPACGREHSWMDKDDVQTRSFRGVPLQYQEICFACLDATLNKKATRKPRLSDLDGIREISSMISDLPLPSLYDVIMRQAKTLDVAVRVLARAKDLVQFSALASKHGSWFAVLAKSRCLPEGARREVYGTRVLSNDGHECLSMAEKQIDDELHRLGIQHRKEVAYPHAPFVCDWVVEGAGGLVFIEYFGLAGRESYDEKILKKRAVLSSSGFALIELYQHDLDHLAERLSGLIGAPRP